MKRLGLQLHRAIIICGVVSLTLASNALPAASSLAPPSDFVRLVNQQDFGKAIAMIEKNPDLRRRLVRGTRLGDRAWLMLSLSLRGSTSASLNEELGDAIKASLDSRPAVALSIQSIPLTWLCDGGDIDTDPSMNLDLELAAVRRRITRLTVMRPNIGSRQTGCIDELRKFEAAIANAKLEGTKGLNSIGR